MWSADEGGKTTDPDCLVPFSGSTCQTQQVLQQALLNSHLSEARKK
ncbi:hypothetical protein Nmel_008249, partial [Mimus melanotis]